MARAIWSGSISFGLLNVPVKLYSAVSRNPTVAELAAKRNVDPVEVMMDLAVESNFNQLFMQFDMATVPKSERSAAGRTAAFSMA